MAKCKCGCGFEASKAGKFVYGHKKIWEASWDKKCECGCGKVTTPGYDFIHGHNANIITEEQWKVRGKQISKTKRENLMTEEQRQHFREINLGANNPAYGKAVSEETRKKRSESIKRKYREDPEWKERRDRASKEALRRPEVRVRLSASQMGRTVSEETREKIRKSNKETWSDEERREKHSELMTKAMNQPEVRARLEEIYSSEEWPQKMRRIMLDIWADPEQRERRLKRIREVTSSEEWLKNVRATRLRGSDHPNWRGGYAKGPYGPGFTQALRRSVRERDGFVCMLCGISEEEAGTPHSAHHIDYDKDNHSADNLIALCISCHGKTNVDREHWQRFFGRLLRVSAA